MAVLISEKDFYRLERTVRTVERMVLQQQRRSRPVLAGVGGVSRAKIQSVQENTNGIISVKKYSADDEETGDAFDVYAFADKSVDDIDDYAPHLAAGDIIFIKSVDNVYYIDWSPTDFGQW